MSENPYESPLGKGDAPPATHTLRNRVIGWCLSLALIAMVIALLLPARRGAREAARRNQCMSQMKQIGLALLNYEQDHGTLPPAYTVDADGNRLHSWRTLLLPYLEEKALYETIDLTKPWDDSTNQAARETHLDCYLCPSADHPLGMTTYLAVVGPECVFTGNSPRKSSEVTDGVGQTITVVDAGPDQAVSWMSPEDLTVDDVLAFESQDRSNHPHVFQAVFLDGRAQAIQRDRDPEILRSMLTIAGGESIDE